MPIMNVVNTLRAPTQGCKTLGGEPTPAMKDVLSWRVCENDREAGLAEISKALDPLVGVSKPGRVTLLGWRYVDRRSADAGDIHLELGEARPLPVPGEITQWTEEDSGPLWQRSRRLAGQLLALALEVESAGLLAELFRDNQFFFHVGQPVFSEAHYLLGSRSWFVEGSPDHPRAGCHEGMAGLLGRVLWGMRSWDELEWVARRDAELPKEGENRAGMVVGRLAQGQYRDLQEAWREWNSREELPESALVTRHGNPLSSYDARLNQGLFPPLLVSTVEEPAAPEPADEPAVEQFQVPRVPSHDRRGHQVAAPPRVEIQPEPIEALASFYALPPNAANARRLGAWLEQHPEPGSIELPPAELLANSEAHADYRYYLVALLARASNGEEMLWQLFLQGHAYPALGPLAPLQAIWRERTLDWMTATEDATPYQLNCLRDWIGRDEILARSVMASAPEVFRLFAYRPGRVEAERALPSLLGALNTPLGEVAADSLMHWLDHPEVAEGVQKQLEQTAGRAQGACRLAARLWPGQLAGVEERLEQDLSMERKCALVRGLRHYGEAARPLLEWLLLHRSLEIPIVAAAVLGPEQALLRQIARDYCAQPYQQLLAWTWTFAEPTAPTGIEAIGFLDVLIEERNDEYFVARVHQVQAKIRLEFEEPAEVWVPTPAWRPEPGEVARCPESIRNELLELVNRPVPENRFSRRGLQPTLLARANRERWGELLAYLQAHFPDPVLLASLHRTLERQDECELANFHARLEFLSQPR